MRLMSISKVERGHTNILGRANSMCEGTEPANNNLLLHANCILSICAGGFSSLISNLHINSQGRFLYFLFLPFLFYWMRKLSLKECVTSPKAIPADLAFDATFGWLPIGAHTLVIIVGKREGYIVTEETLMCRDFIMGNEWRTAKKK